MPNMRLGEYVSVDREAEEFSELGGVYAGWGENGLLSILAGAGVVVMKCGDADLRPGPGGQALQEEQYDNKKARELLRLKAWNGVSPWAVHRLETKRHRR